MRIPPGGAKAKREAEWVALEEEALAIADGTSSATPRVFHLRALARALRKLGAELCQNQKRP